jgi:hypothetical protein
MEMTAANAMATIEELAKNLPPLYMLELSFYPDTEHRNPWIKLWAEGKVYTCETIKDALILARNLTRPASIPPLKAKRTKQGELYLGDDFFTSWLALDQRLLPELPNGFECLVNYSPTAIWSATVPTETPT